MASNDSAHESWKERRDRLNRECRAATGRVKLTYDSKNTHNEVSITGEVIDPVEEEYEPLRMKTSERKGHVVVDHNAIVRTAVADEDSDRRRWKNSLGRLVSIEELR